MKYIIWPILLFIYAAVIFVFVYMFLKPIAYIITLLWTFDNNLALNVIMGIDINTKNSTDTKYLILHYFYCQKSKNIYDSVSTKYPIYKSVFHQVFIENLK